MPVLEKTQVLVLLKTLFRLIRATGGQPVPSLLWLGENPIPIQDAAKRLPALNITGVINDHISTDIPTLRKLLDSWLYSQPKSTRGYNQVTRAMTEFLALPGQRQKMQYIAAEYPNTLGLANSCDDLEAVTDFFGEVKTALEIVEQRLQDGLIWVAHWDRLNSVLSGARSLLPQVQLMESPKSEMIEMSRVLIRAKKEFWDTFTFWSSTRVQALVPPGKNGLEVIKTLLADAVEMGDISFDQIINGLREYDPSFSLAWLPGNPINADGIEAIRLVWAEINNLLRDVAHCTEQKCDKHEQARVVLIGDIDEAVCTIGIGHKSFNNGQRSTWVSELTSLAKRLDVLRQDGIIFDPAIRLSVFSARAILQQGTEDAARLARLDEQALKTRQSQANLTAPKQSLMKLDGYASWVPWLHQLAEFTRDITREQSKVAMVMSSLKDREDINFLAGTTSYKELMVYLRRKYHRPDEVASTILGRINDFKMPLNDKSIQKNNMLLMQNIRRDLTRVGMKKRLDLYYIKQAGPKVFTTDEHSEFLRAKMKDNEEKLSLTRRKKKLARTVIVAGNLPLVSSSGLVPARPAGGRVSPAGSVHLSEDEQFQDVDIADRQRALDDSSDSDSDEDNNSDITAVGSMFSRARITENRDSKRDRRFFFAHIERVLALTRILEGIAFANSPVEKSGKPKKNTSHGFAAGTDVDLECILNGCTSKHKSTKGKPTQSLAFCKKFIDKKLPLKIQDVKTYKVCIKCLGPGHLADACRLHLVCRSCKSDQHSTLLCQEATASNPKKKAGTGSAPKKKDKLKTASNKIDVEVTEGAEIATEEVTESETESNLLNLQNFEETESEQFLLSRVNSPVAFTQIGSGSIMNNKTRAWEGVKILFDQGSSDCWISERFAKNMGCKPLANWEGFLTTIQGREEINRPAVQFSLYNYETKQNVKIQAIVSDNKVISKKPKILEEKFKRLCAAFSLNPNQVDNNAGNCEILIGLKNQSIQTTRICTFKSKDYPEVGIYESPIVEKMIFVGEDSSRTHASSFATKLELKQNLPNSVSFSSHTSPKDINKDTFDDEDSLLNEPSTEAQNEKAAHNQSGRPACSHLTPDEVLSSPESQESNTEPGNNKEVSGEDLAGDLEDLAEMARATEHPLETNAALLHTLFKFNPNSNLKDYLAIKTGTPKLYCTLVEILTALKHIIREEELFDKNNPSCILCSAELEVALGLKSLHVTEVRDTVLAQLTRVPDSRLSTSFKTHLGHCRRAASGISGLWSPNLHVVTPVARHPAPPSHALGVAGIDSAIFTDKNARFFLKPKFLKVLLSVPGSDHRQIVFTYEEITLLLSQYILLKRNQLFDPRNIKLAMVANDPLGEAFNVRAFHRCQVNNLLRTQLIPVDTRNFSHVVLRARPGPPATVASKVKTEGLEALAIAVGTKPAPATPAPATPQLLNGCTPHIRVNPFFGPTTDSSGAPLAPDKSSKFTPWMKVPTDEPGELGEPKPQGGARLTLRSRIPDESEPMDNVHFLPIQPHSRPVTIVPKLEMLIGGDHLADHLRHFFVDGFGPLDPTQSVEQPRQSTRKTGINNFIKEGIFSNIGAHVLGPVEFKMGQFGKKGIDILWILQVTCLNSGAVSFNLMEEYSPLGFLEAFQAHARRVRYPTHVTTSLKGRFKRSTRLSATGVSLSSKVLAVTGIEYLLTETQNLYPSIEFCVDETSQAINWLTVFNIEVTKIVLKHLIDSIQQASSPFGSFFAILNAFEKIGSLLNQRAVFHNNISTMSVKGIIFPSPENLEISENNKHEDNLAIAIQKGPVDVTRDRDIMMFQSGSETVHQEFARLFKEALKDSSFMRSGKHQVKAMSKRRLFKEDDFILIITDQGIKYGLVNVAISNEIISARLLNKHRKIRSELRVEEFASEQCTLLHRKIEA